MKTKTNKSNRPVNPGVQTVNKSTLSRIFNFLFMFFFFSYKIHAVIVVIDKYILSYTHTHTSKNHTTKRFAATPSLVEVARWGK